MSAAELAWCGVPTILQTLVLVRHSEQSASDDGSVRCSAKRVEQTQRVRWRGQRIESGRWRCEIRVVVSYQTKATVLSCESV